MDAIKVKPAVSQKAVFQLRCPRCGKIQNFALIRHGTDLSVLDFRIKHLRDHATAVCGGCAAVFGVKESVAAALFKGERSAVTPEDLEEKV